MNKYTVCGTQMVHTRNTVHNQLCVLIDVSFIFVLAMIIAFPLVYLLAKN